MSDTTGALAAALAKAQGDNAHPSVEAGILHAMCYRPERSGRQHSARSISDRIMARVVFGASDCWHYCGVRNAFGYGRITYQGRTQVVHRLLYEAAVGPIPTGLSALHRCDNPSCVNPDHIWIGTYSDNIRDSYAKGRRGRQ